MPIDLPTLVLAILQVLTALQGLPAVLAYVLQIAEQFGLTVAAANTISFVVNVLAFIGIGYLLLTGQGALAQTIDAALVGVAKLLADIVIILGTLGGFGYATLKTAEYRLRHRAVRLNL